LGACKVEQGSLHARRDAGGLHTLLCGFELDDHLANLVIEMLLELVDGVRELLHGLGEF